MTEESWEWLDLPTVGMISVVGAVVGGVEADDNDDGVADENDDDDDDDDVGG